MVQRIEYQVKMKILFILSFRLKLNKKNQSTYFHANGVSRHNVEFS